MGVKRVMPKTGTCTNARRKTRKRTRMQTSGHSRNGNYLTQLESVGDARLFLRLIWTLVEKGAKCSVCYVLNFIELFSSTFFSIACFFLLQIGE